MKIDKNKLQEYLRKMPEDTKIYFGADSERIRVDGVWYVDYLLVIIVHEGGNKGAKIFGEIQRERDYDKNLSRPKNRMMTEVYKISELYLNLRDAVEEFDVEIHVDIATNPKYGSHVACKEAIGYIRGTCFVEPVLKPKSWAASNCADNLKNFINLRKEASY
jgi:predicted RNase H-related nuclease YkuK (DUF458 family)